MTSAAVAAQRLGGRRGTRAAPGPLARLGARLPQIRPFKALTVAGFSMALVGIVANAMVFQRGHHPAPLFGFGQSVDGTPDAAQQPAPAQRADAAPPAQAPASVERTGTIPPPVPAPAAVPAVASPVPATATPRAAPAHHAAAKPRQEDGIGGLLKAKPTAAEAHPRPAAEAHPSPAAEAHPRPGHAVPKAAKAAEAALAEPRVKAEAKRAAEKPGADHKPAAAPSPSHHRIAKVDAPSTADAPPAKKAAKVP